MLEQTTAAPAAPEYLTEPEAASLLDVSPRTMQRWRYKGLGPDFIRWGERKVRYTRAALQAWAESRRGVPA